MVQAKASARFFGGRNAEAHGKEAEAFSTASVSYNDNDIVGIRSDLGLSAAEYRDVTEQLARGQLLAVRRIRLKV